MNQHCILHYPFLDCKTLSPERTPIVIQLCLRSWIRLWKKYHYEPFDFIHHFSSNVAFTNIFVWSTGQSGEETKYWVPSVQGQWTVNSSCGCGNFLKITHFPFIGQFILCVYRINKNRSQCKTKCDLYCSIWLHLCHVYHDISRHIIYWAPCVILVLQLVKYETIMYPYSQSENMFLPVAKVKI